MKTTPSFIATRHRQSFRVFTASPPMLIGGKNSPLRVGATFLECFRERRQTVLTAPRHLTIGGHFSRPLRPKNYPVADFRVNGLNKGRTGATRALRTMPLKPCWVREPGEKDYTMTQGTTSDYHCAKLQELLAKLAGIALLASLMLTTEAMFCSVVEEVDV